VGGCDFCNGKSVIKCGENHICIDGDTLYVYVASEMCHSQEYKIKMCPLCGREVSESER
jgi:hypothetical protein